MAWNDIYQDDKAIQLSISVGGHKYYFGKGVEIKVERKIGDTLNKFSLGIMDDGTENYTQFEQIIVNRFVNIEIEYGNSSKGKSQWTGFVVDYQPVFFGTSTKLTVTGYITRKQAGLPDQSSPYLYYIDWAPVVGMRKDVEKDWDDIYNGNFSFTTDSFGEELDDKPIESSKEAYETLESIINQTISTYSNNQYNNLKNRLYSQIANFDWDNADYYTQQLRGWDENGEIGKVTSIYFYYDETSGRYDLSSFYILQNNATEPIPYGEDPFTYVPVASIDDWYKVLSADLIKDLKAANDKITKYEDLLWELNNATNTDTYGQAAKEFFGIGHVPWDYNLMDSYQGNILFQKFSHPNDSRRSIARVVPDVFIPWDKDLPAAPEYLTKDGRPMSGSLDKFPDSAINDIKVFGLQYTFNEAVYIANPDNPYAAYQILEKDIHGVRRVYYVEETGTYYIWVGDIPGLYEEWKKNKWQYSNTGRGYFTTGGDDNNIYSGVDGKFTPRTTKPEAGNKFYIRDDSGGWSQCIKGKPTDANCDVLANCVGYACGRFNEIIGEMRYPGFNCNAENFIERAQQYYPQLDIVNYPTIGGIMVWQKGATLSGKDGAGHVAIVEKINNSNSILTSESGYGGSAFWTQTRTNDNGNWGSSYKFRGCIVNPAVGRATSTSDIQSTSISGAIYADEMPDTKTFSENTSYKAGTLLIFDKYTHGKVLKDFTTGDFENFWTDIGWSNKDKDEWDKHIANGNIKLFTEEEWEQYRFYGEGNKRYTIAPLEANEDKGIKAMTTEQRVTKYLQAAYRSAMPLNYGQVYISDIVAQLCILEGWQNPVIVPTTSVSYKSSFLSMNGMGALEYISQQLCPNACEDGGTGRVGFHCYFDKSGIFHFEPVDVNGKGEKTILSTGYNIKNSPVMSFTVRSNGQILMLGVDEDYNGVNNLRGDTISITPNKGELTMSEIERELGGTATFFNLSLYNYYGYDTSSTSDYNTFTEKITSLKGVSKEMPYGSTLVRRVYESSTSSSTVAATTAIQDLQKLRNVSIQAEMTMLGDNTITPGKYIDIINYTRKGLHYTTGKYYVKTITDSVTSANGFTQSLELYRWSETVTIMNTSPDNSKRVSVGIKSKAEEALEAYQQGGIDKLDQWITDNISTDE